jgi:hypothetical protein
MVDTLRVYLNPTLCLFEASKQFFLPRSNRRLAGHRRRLKKIPGVAKPGDGQEAGSHFFVFKKGR